MSEALRRSVEKVFGNTEARVVAVYQVSTKQANTTEYHRIPSNTTDNRQATITDNQQSPTINSQARHFFGL